MLCASRRRRTPVAALTLLLLGVGPPNPPPNPAAAIAAAAGHPARLHLRAERWRLDGANAVLSVETAGAARLEQACTDDVCTGSFFDGTHLLRFGINGTLLPDRNDDDADERTFAAIASTAFAEPEFVAAGGSVSDLPPAGDGRQRFAVRAPGGADLVAVADPKTQRLVAVERLGGQPFRPLAASSAAGPLVYAADAASSVSAVGATLAPPGGPHVRPNADGPADVALLSADLPIAGCRIDDRPARCLLDTGTTPSAVTLPFAEALGREPRGAIVIAGVEPYVTGAIDAGPIRIGGAVVDRLTFAVIPHLHAAPFDAILGADVLARLRVGLRFGQRRVRIEPAAADPPADAAAVTFGGGVPYVAVRLGSGDDEPMLFDTGDTALLSIGYDRFRGTPAAFVIAGAGTARGTGAAIRDTLEATIDRAQVAGVALDGVAVGIVRGQHVGHVGYRFTAHCAQLILDLHHARIACANANR